MHTASRIARVAVGAGRWFPGNRQELQKMLNAFIDGGKGPAVRGRIASVIAPHAGYIYSGPVAGYAFRAVRDNAQAASAPDLAVVLGFSHRGSFRGTALMDGATFTTPLGSARLDTDAAAALMAADPRITWDYRPHMGEHSAENEVPFLQTVLPDTPLVIGLIGSHDPAALDGLVSALQALSRKKKVLVVASSDMLHDPDYEKVRKTDLATLRKVAALDVTGVTGDWDYTQQVFCGIAPVICAMKYARQQGCSKATILRYRNSGDDYPESRGQWVVGYGAVAFPV
jgi:AmmeMemoRadiSam system protein B